MFVYRSSVTLVVFLFTLLFFTPSPQAARVGVNFVPHSDPLLHSYTVHYGDVSGSYTSELVLTAPEIVDGAVTAEVEGLTVGETYYFAVTSNNGILESAYSNEMAFTVPLPLPPVADSIVISGVEDVPCHGQLKAVNPEEDSLHYQIVTPPLNGFVTIDETTGSFIFSPEPDFNGEASFTYCASNAVGDSNIATATISLAAVNDLPVAGDRSITVQEDGALSGKLDASDPDGDTLTFAITTHPGKGQAVMSSSGDFTYTASPGLTGSDSFSYSVSDGSPHPVIAHVTVDIVDVNHAPVVFNGSFTTDDQTVITGQLTGEDQDGDALSFSILSPPSAGTVTVGENGGFFYTPTLKGDSQDSFAFQATDGTLSSNMGRIDITITAAADQNRMELGEIDVTSNWSEVQFESSFATPALIAKAVTANDNDMGVIQIRNLTPTGFEIRFKEWGYLDGTHQAETVTYLVMEQGVHQLEEDLLAVAGCTEISGLNNYQTTLFPAQFDSTPVIMASIISENESDTVTLRISDITVDTFSVAMQEQEENDGNHSHETFCYIGLEQWSGVSNDLLLEIKRTEDTITHEPQTIGHTEKFPEPPITLSAMQTANGGNTAVLGAQHVTLESVTVSVVEEQSKDNELNHIGEAAGIIAIAAFSAEADSDGDGLSNGQERLLTTHPGLADSDQDGSEDGAEYAYWTDQNIDPLGDIDGDSVANLLDADADNDGVLDGIEIAEGSDPADSFSSPTLFKLEVGEIGLTHDPVRVQFGSPFANPVIIANIVSEKGTDPSTLSISEIDASGFTIQIREYEYLDGGHNQEMVNYLVIEQGLYTLDDGTIIEAGKFTTSVTSPYTPVSLSAASSQTPVVLTSLNSNNEQDCAIGRIRNVSSTGFEFIVQEQEANKQIHAAEEVGFLAWTRGSGDVNNLHFEAGLTPDAVTHAKYTVSLVEDFPELPFHFAAMQTLDGKDTSTIRITQADTGSMTIHVEEEKSKDNEINHTKEIAGYLVILPQ